MASHTKPVSRGEGSLAPRSACKLRLLLPFAVRRLGLRQLRQLRLFEVVVSIKRGW